MFYIQIIENVGLLVALVAVYGQIIRRWKESAFSSQVVSGFLFGCVALIGMMAPVFLMSGLIFDGRSIVLSVAGLFGGPVTAGIAVIMTGAYRLWLGGPGAFMGTCVILESASLGVAFYYLRQHHPALTRNLYLFAFGLLVHVGMILLMLALPREAMLKTMEHVAVPVMLIYPAATLLICRLFLDQESRISAEQALRESEQRYRAVFDNAAIGIDTIAADGRIVQVNPALCSMLGYTEDEIKQLTFDKITYPDDRHISGQKLESLIAGEIDSYRLEKRYVRKDGKIVWGELSLSPIEDANGNPAGMVAAITDITESKYLEMALRESEERHRIVADFTYDWEYWLDGEGNFLYVSPSCERITGYTAQEFVDDPNLMNRIIHPDDSEKMLEHYHNLRKVTPDAVEKVDFRIIRRDGETRWIGHVCQPVCDQDGRPSGRRGSNRDITDRKRAEEELNASRTSFTGIVENSSDGILVVDEEGKILYANPSACSLFGKKAESIVGNVFGQPLSNGARFEIDIVRAEGQLGAAEMRVARTDWNLKPSWLILLRDVTERLRAEAETKLNELRMQSLYEISQYKAENVQDLLDFTLDKAVSLTGSKVGYIYHYDENTQQLTLNIWSKEVMNQCEVAEPKNVYQLEKIGLWGEAVRQKRAIVVNDFQAHNPGKNGYPEGHLELFRFLTAPVFREDKVIAVVGVANKTSDYDDSDVRQLSLLMDSVWRMIESRQGEEAQRLLSTAIEQSADAIIVTDCAGIIQYVNPAQEMLSGYSRNELLGQTPNIFKSDFHDDNLYDKLWGVINSGNFWSGRFVNRKKDGAVYHEDVSVSPVYNKSGKLTNFVVVEHDVTGHIKLSEQLFQAQKMESIGTLAGGIAHDFNNVLTIVLGFTELMLFDMDKNKKEYQQLQNVAAASKRGADLVKGLLAFSRKSEIKAKPIDLNNQVRPTVQMLEHTISKLISIELDFGEDIKPIFADPGQIEQILLNLAVNARDAMLNGGKLRISTRNTVLDNNFLGQSPDTEPGSYVRLSVSDTGAGMDKQTMGRIFEPFFTTKEIGKGTGLGLATVFGIIKQHNGHITCSSEPGFGTTFDIYFPAFVPLTVDGPGAITENGFTGGTETILLADDETLIRDLGRKLLTLAGYAVLTAENGRQALEIYNNHRKDISLVILDLLMPEMGGKECCEALLEIDPSLKVVMASGHASGGTEASIEGLGAKAFIRKPFAGSNLLRLIRNVLDNQ